MNEKKIDGKEVSLIARRYFEEIFNTKYVYFEAIKVNFDKQNNVWHLDVEIGPFYSNKKRYELEISADGDVGNVEQISNATGN